ncbi:MAG: protein kinase domain-containing protein, partial [Pyrinomonadaceae bacterium]
MSIADGTRFGRYEIISHLGTGGMGEVYRAEDSQLGRPVALKLLTEHFTSEDNRLRRFGQEARSISSLNHPNIITIYEVGEAEGAHFIATEFVDGETLRQRLARSHPELHEALDVAVQIAGALVAAHQAGVIHRDIKPENIMVRRDGYIKVLDFGLAKLTEPEAAGPEAPTRGMVNTAPGVVMGTARYMSPEQARGREVDARTDVWSLGVVLYEMVAGRPPFDGETHGDIISLILQREAPPVARYAPEIPPELGRIITKALRKDRDERYQTVKDMALDLKSLKQELEFDAKLRGSGVFAARATQSGATRTGGAMLSATVSEQNGLTGAVNQAHSTGPSYSAARDRGVSSAEYIVTGIRRHKRGAAVALASLVLAVVAGAYWIKGGMTARPVDSMAVLPFANAGADPDAEYLSDGVTESVINSLARLPGLRVMSRNAVFRYKGRQADASAIGRELN